MADLSSYKPVNNRVLIETIAVEEKTKTNIILLDKPSKSKLVRGRVVVSGDPLVQAGEVVFHRPGIGYDVIVDGKPFLLVKASEIELVQSN